MSRIVRVGLVQSACTPTREANVAQALHGIAAAARGGAEVVCLQELFAGEYPCQSEDHEQFGAAEAVPGIVCCSTKSTIGLGSLSEWGWWPTPRLAITRIEPPSSL